MCSNCILNSRPKHDLEHEFIAVHDPMRDIVVHVIHEDEAPADTGNASIEEPRHNAFCDVCKKGIKGVRWKCVDCPGTCKGGAHYWDSALADTEPLT